MSWSVIITLIVFGLLALVLEFLIIPGGVVGVIGFLTMISGVVCTYASKGMRAGHITLVITLLVSVVVIVLLLRSRTWRKCELKTEIDKKMNEFDESEVYVGAVGRTISRLAPSGKAVFGSETIEVASSFGLIDENSDIVVEKIEGNKIFVKLNN